MTTRRTATLARNRDTEGEVMPGKMKRRSRRHRRPALLPAEALRAAQRRRLFVLVQDNGSWVIFDGDRAGDGRELLTYSPRSGTYSHGGGRGQVAGWQRALQLAAARRPAARLDPAGPAQGPHPRI